MRTKIVSTNTNSNTNSTANATAGATGAGETMGQVFARVCQGLPSSEVSMCWSRDGLVFTMAYESDPVVEGRFFFCSYQRAVGPAYRVERAGCWLEASPRVRVRHWNDGAVEMEGRTEVVAVAKPGFEDHDFCGYCHADNGPGGAWRQGWDCCLCGGN